MLLVTKVVETEEDVCIVEAAATFGVEIVGTLTMSVGEKNRIESTVTERVVRTLSAIRVSYCGGGPRQVRRLYGKLQKKIMTLDDRVLQRVKFCHHKFSLGSSTLHMLRFVAAVSLY